MAMSGFLLLRKDRPAWPRPIRVGPPWVAVAAVLFVFDLTILVWGAANVGLAYGESTRSTLLPALFVLAVALALYVYRVVGQEKKPFRLRLPAPATPEEEARLDVETRTI
jgi:hypothetical protein